MKVPITVKHIDRILPVYTAMLETLRDSSIRYRVLRETVQKYNLDALANPVVDNVIYNDLVINFRGTVIIAIMDLSIIIKNIKLSKDKWERAFYFRQGTLLIYESINVYNKQNKIISPILKSNFPEISDLYTNQFRKIRDFKKVYKFDSQMSELRNNTIGHINDNIFSYCIMLSKITPAFLKKGMLEYLEFLIGLEKMQEEIEKNLINRVLVLKGKSMEDLISKNDVQMKKLKIPKMLR